MSSSQRVCFAVTLDLRGFVKGFPAHPRFSVVAVQALAGEGIALGEHDAVAEVTVVGDGQDLAASLILVALQPAPEVARVVAAQRLQGRIGLHHAGLGAVVAIDHHAMQVVAAGVRRPLVTDEGGESAGLVVRIRGLDHLLPRCAVGLRTGQRLQPRRKVTLRESLDDLDGHLHGRLAAFLDHLVPAPTRWIGQELGAARQQLREKTHVVRVVGNHQEVQRPGQSDLQAGGRGQLLAARKAVGLLRPEPRAEGPGVHRQVRVQVRVPPEHPVGEVAPRVG
jgi:hypothetical protein